MVKRCDFGWWGCSVADFCWLYIYILRVYVPFSWFSEV